MYLFLINGELSSDKCRVSLVLSLYLFSRKLFYILKSYLYLFQYSTSEELCKVNMKGKTIYVGMLTFTGLLYVISKTQENTNDQVGTGETNSAVSIPCNIVQELQMLIGSSI